MAEIMISVSTEVTKGDIYYTFLLAQGLLKHSLLLGAGSHSSPFCLILCRAQCVKLLSESSDKEAK